MGKQTVEAASSSNLLMLVLAQQSIGRPLSSEKHFSLKIIKIVFLTAIELRYRGPTSDKSSGDVYSSSGFGR